MTAGEDEEQEGTGLVAVLLYARSAGCRVRDRAILVAPVRYWDAYIVRQDRRQQSKSIIRNWRRSGGSSAAASDRPTEQCAVQPAGGAFLDDGSR